MGFMVRAILVTGFFFACLKGRCEVISPSNIDGFVKIVVE